jgi:PhnB protein
MARTGTYLNFARETEQAFNFYKSIFGGDFIAPGFRRFSDMPPHEGAPPIAEADKKLIMHVALPITGGHVLMGSDAPESMGHKVDKGNNVYITLDTDTRAEADRLFKGLEAGGEVEMQLQEMFWGDYFGTLTDKFGIKWMFNSAAKK